MESVIHNLSIPTASNIMQIIDNAITTLVGEDLRGAYKWFAILAGANGFIYGIPFHGRRVIKFNPIDKSMTRIGPDLGDGSKWYEGAMADNGIIYCVPFDSNHGILKIDTKTDTAKERNRNLLPELGTSTYSVWESCAVARSGCNYFMPYNARRIMKLDPNNNDSISSVGDDLGSGKYKYRGTVVGINGWVYGMPYKSKRIIKYDPINGNTSFVGEEAAEYFHLHRRCFRKR